MLESVAEHPERLVLVVVGSGLAAEVEDRPLATMLARRCSEALDDAVDGPPGTMRAIACTDLWYLNEASVRSGPVIAVGGPERNALTAHLTGRFERRFGVHGQWVIQTPGEADDLAVLVWGSGNGTSRAVSTFVQEMLDSFVAACVVRASRVAR